MVREKILVRKLLHFKINSKMLVLYFGTNKVKKKTPSHYKQEHKFVTSTSNKHSYGPERLKERKRKKEKE